MPRHKNTCSDYEKYQSIFLRAELGGHYSFSVSSPGHHRDLCAQRQIRIEMDLQVRGIVQTVLHVTAKAAEDGWLARIPPCVHENYCPTIAPPWLAGTGTRMWIRGYPDPPNTSQKDHQFVQILPLIYVHMLSPNRMNYSRFECKSSVK
jgi:hypothetical protein